VDFLSRGPVATDHAGEALGVRGEEGHLALDVRRSAAMSVRFDKLAYGEAVGHDHHKPLDVASSFEFRSYDIVSSESMPMAP
jgi:hypothetical protein